MKIIPASLGLAILVLYVIVASFVSRETIPDFSTISDVKIKKQTFFDFVYPRLKAVNDKILDQRQDLLAIDEQLRNGEELNYFEARELESLAEEYKIEYDQSQPAESVRILLRRVDVVPPSLALAQSANESAWGTSRFATEGSNYFGQWCFTEGCGIVPSSRSDGRRHEVRVFDSVEESVASYIRNLNSHPAYRQLRTIRQTKRNEKNFFRGYTLAPGLSKYSEKGDEYIQSIQSMISRNQLQDYDDRFWSETENTSR